MDTYSIFDFYKTIQNCFAVGLAMSFLLFFIGTLSLMENINKKVFCATIILFILFCLFLTGFLYFEYLQVR